MTILPSVVVPSSPLTGSFSEVVSIVVVIVCVLVFVLLVSSLLLSLTCYCCWKRHSRKKKEKRQKSAQEKVQYSIPAESYLFASGGGKEGGGGVSGNGVVRPRERRLPLPPEPEIELGGGESYYEELDEVAVDMSSGVTRPRLPTFSSDASETGGTELETVISAATDAQLVTS